MKECPWGEHRLYQGETWPIPIGWRHKPTDRKIDYIIRCRRCPIWITCAYSLDELIAHPEWDKKGDYRRQKEGACVTLTDADTA